MRKSTIVLLIILVLLVGLVLGYKFLNPKFNKEWLTCESHEDCMLVEDWSICSCGPMSINKDHESGYAWYSLRKKLSTKSLFPGKVFCEVCNFIKDPVPRCIRNMCAVRPSCGGQGYRITEDPGASCCEGFVELPVFRPTGERKEDYFICAACGDGRCLQGENKYNCPEDCS